MMRQSLLVVVLGSALLSLPAHAEKDRYDVGEAVPAFTLKAVNGDDVGETYIGIDRYFGPTAKDPKKTVVLSFFATWCEPCKKEMPLLAALYEAYKAKGLQVVLVSIDKEPDKVEQARTIAKDVGVKFPVLSDRFNIVAKRYFISKLPNVYVLNGEGKVTMVNVGYNEDISRGLVDEIRKGIGEPTSEPIPAEVQKQMAHAGSGAPASVVVPAEGGSQGGASGQTASAQGGTIPAPEAAEPAEDAGTKGKGKNKGKAKGKGKGKSKGGD